MALGVVSDAKQAYRDREHELRQEAMRALAPFEAELERAIVRADRAGVPRRQIGITGLGTKATAQLYAILDKQKKGQ